MPRGRPTLSPRRYISIYLEQELDAEMRMLKPELQDITGFTKYGAISKYFNRLLREDLEKLKERIKEENDKRINPIHSSEENQNV